MLHQIDGGGAVRWPGEPIDYHPAMLGWPLPDPETRCARLPVAVAACLLAALPAAAAPQAPPWPPGTAELPPDPALRFAELDNGLRLAWQTHARPAGACSLRLVVHVGSLAEADTELGMAHFVEHMGLRGTARYRDGALIDWAQQNGLGFGRHLNGFTSYADTTYVLALPRNDEQLLREALEVLRDYAAGMRFDPDAVALERGVVDAEERERDAAEQRAQLAL